MENYRRETEIQKLIEEEILNELVYVDWGVLWEYLKLYLKVYSLEELS